MLILYHVVNNVKDFFPQNVGNFEKICSGNIKILKHIFKQKHIDKTKAV